MKNKTKSTAKTKNTAKANSTTPKAKSSKVTPDWITSKTTRFVALVIVVFVLSTWFLMNIGGGEGKKSNTPMLIAPRVVHVSGSTDKQSAPETNIQEKYAYLLWWDKDGQQFGKGDQKKFFDATIITNTPSAFIIKARRMRHDGQLSTLTLEWDKTTPQGIWVQHTPETGNGEWYLQENGKEWRGLMTDGGTNQALLFLKQKL